MKFQLVFISLVISLFNSNAQSFSPNFLGDDFLLYKGVLLEIKDDSISGLPFSFYDDIKYCISDTDYHVLYRDSTYTKNTNRDSLKNRTFIVENIVDRNGVASTSNSILDRPIFILKDIKTNQKIYYKYDNDFPFNTSPITINQHEMCSKIEKNIVQKTGAVIYNSPETSNNQPAFASIAKQNSGLKDEYFLSLYLRGEKSDKKRNGAYIYLTNGKRIFKQAEIIIEQNKNDQSYTSIVPLTVNDLKKLREINIKKIKLNVHEREVNSVDSDIFKAYVNCIMKAK